MENRLNKYRDEEVSKFRAQMLKFVKGFVLPFSTLSVGNGLGELESC